MFGVQCDSVFKAYASFGGSEVKASALQCRRPGFDPWVGKIPWRRKWQPTPVFLPGESHGRRSLVGYSPRGHKESDMTERLHFHCSYDKILAIFLYCTLLFCVVHSSLCLEFLYLFCPSSFPLVVTGLFFISVSLFLFCYDICLFYFLESPYQ